MLYAWPRMHNRVHEKCCKVSSNFLQKLSSKAEGSGGWLQHQIWRVQSEKSILDSDAFYIFYTAQSYSVRFDRRLKDKTQKTWTQKRWLMAPFLQTAHLRPYTKTNQNKDESANSQTRFKSALLQRAKEDASMDLKIFVPLHINQIIDIKRKRNVAEIKSRSPDVVLLLLFPMQNPIPKSITQKGGWRGAWKARKLEDGRSARGHSFMNVIRGGVKVSLFLLWIFFQTNATISIKNEEKGQF